jgi:hypothetical protein
MYRKEDEVSFLAETRQAIAASGHKPEDIIYIGSTGDGVCYETSWDEFESLADFTYDSGFGGAEVATDLRIVFSDGADMHRGEYDGSGWWEFSYPFVRPEHTEPIRRLRGGMWDTLAELQADDV